VVLPGLIVPVGSDAFADRGPDESSATVPVPGLAFGLLGPLTVTVDGRPVELSGTRTRALLALLLVQANRVVSADRLIDDLWAGEPTPGATATLQGYVSELRKALATALGGPAPVDTRRPGYMVRVDPEQLDVLRFERLVERAHVASQNGDGEDVADTLREALALWRGPALADFADEPFARPVAAKLEETRLWALDKRIEAELQSGCHGDLAAELPAIIAEHPLREGLWAQWMLALYRCGRQAEALRAYQDLRRRLRDELAIEPSPALQRLENAILLQDPALELVPGVTSATPRPSPAPSPAPGPADLGARLPAHLTRFVGRARELDEAKALLARSRLLTLAGTGGSGKTRLAVRLAAEVAPKFRDGVRFVDLAAVTDPAQVPAALAAALGFERRGAEAEDLCAHLADSRALLLFDNCEHVIEAAADLIERILARCGGTKVLATTQEELGIAGEVVWRLLPLSVPPPPHQATPNELLASEAVQLFLDRAGVANPGFSYDEVGLRWVAHICRRLDGIPLAVELAAGLTNVLALDEIALRLHDRFNLLTGRSRRTVPRQRTLRAAIDWSYDLLGDSERRLFQRLSVFVGDFSLDAVAGVGGRDGAFLTDLSALVGKSMVATVPGPLGSRRYRLLESLRQYGLEMLRSAGAEEDARRAHATHYLEFADAADRKLHGPDAADWSMRVAREFPNLNAALEWCFSGADVELGIELAGALRWWFFPRLGDLALARTWLLGAVEGEHDLPPALRLKALVVLTTIAYGQGDYRWAATWGEEAVSMAEALDDRQELALALMARGGAAAFEGNVARAVECLSRSLQYCDELGDQWGRACVLTFWGTAARRSGDHALARAQLEEAMATFRAMHDEHNQAIPLVQLALLAQQTGDLEGAARYCEEAFVLARRLGDRQLAHGVLCVSGRAQLAMGNREEARRLLVSSLRSSRGAEHFLVVALAVEGLAVVAAEDGRDDEGARLWGYTESLREARGMPLTGARRAEREHHLARARARLGTGEAERALNAGRRMSFEDVLVRVGAVAEPGELVAPRR
jgi:predicted ATPase/DNA-binding SARP family transcriptional activator